MDDNYASDRDEKLDGYKAIMKKSIRMQRESIIDNRRS